MVWTPGHPRLSDLQNTGGIRGNILLGVVRKFLLGGDLVCGKVPGETCGIKPNPPGPGYLLLRKTEGSLPERGENLEFLEGGRLWQDSEGRR